ncbi:c-type cytochrome [uncultured Thiodictyon sp.]|uniref:c-type cytochrome n=1 Tax=uncultured Thiodictyon sp. TaxID=1846217 RepID=UPI0025E17843|nr:c-type cytochrome [uncultured Thiodictyon sp.]
MPLAKTMKGKILGSTLFAMACVNGTTAAASGTVVLVVPPAETIPTGPLGESIVRGRDYLMSTAQRLPEFVGNGLTCKNCHLGNATEVGTVANAAPFIGVVGRFPQFNARDQMVELLERRINDCFERSMNGKPLPLDHPAMVDMVAYMTWLSQGVPIGARVAGSGIPELELARAPNPIDGGVVYKAKCAMCHGADGSGTKSADGDGGYVFPPLWGLQSFAGRAGMARQHTAAGFIKHKMPFGAGDSLSDGEAWDLAAYVLSQVRPD